MHAGASEAARPVDREFTLARVINAPRALVFRSFIEPERMQHWWAPRGFTMLSCALDLREGGKWRMRIRSDETGAVQAEEGVYREIRAPERLVFTQAWVRSNGELTRQTLVTVTFTERLGRTEVNFRQEDFATAASCQAHEEGWSSSLGLLTDYVGERKPT